MWVDSSKAVRLKMVSICIFEEKFRTATRALPGRISGPSPTMFAVFLPPAAKAVSGTRITIEVNLPVCRTGEVNSVIITTGLHPHPRGGRSSRIG
jgi:hypothetical protein